jgi:hypothetical protein
MTRFRLAGAGILALVAALAMPAAPAQAAAADPTREEIFSQLKVDQIPADYVFLIDTSGSMSDDGLYGEVRSTLRSFLTGLSSSDYVAIYTFDNAPRERYLGKAGNVDAMLAGLPKNPTPGGMTDIGAAIERAMVELEREKASAIASVVLITDGEHDAPNASPYRATSSDAWKKLTQRAESLGGRALTGYALPLRGVTGADLLKAVIPKTVTLDPKTIGELPQYLDRAKVQTRIDKAKAALAADTGKGLRADWEVPSNVDIGASNATVKLTLTAETTMAPISVSNLSRGTGTEAELIGELPDRLDLAPGEQRSFTFQLGWEPRPWLIPFRQTKHIAPNLTVSGTVTSPWSQPLLPDIDLATPAQIAGAAPPVTGTATVGTWMAQIITAPTVLALIAIIWLIIYVRRYARQSGVLIASLLMTGEELGRFRLKGRSTKLSGQQLPGGGKVVARRVPRRSENPEGIEYVITYRRHEHTGTSNCPSRGSVLIGGVNFEHIATGQPVHSAPITA